MNKKISKEKIFDVVRSIDSTIIKNIYIFDKISSTNSVTKELAKNGEDQGTIVLAFTQEKGRGRFQRIWESPKGGLYISILLRPTVVSEKTTLIPLVAAIAVSSTIQSYGLSTSIKWPNDIRVHKKKIAGILLESELYKNKLRHIILGIGVNVNIKVHQFSEEIRNTTTSVLNELHAVDIHTFLKNLLLKLDKYYTMFCNEEFDFIISEWKKQSDTLNKRVKIITTSDVITGLAYDVDNSGFLLLITDTGEHKKIMSGDCLYIDEL